MLNDHKNNVYIFLSFGSYPKGCHVHHSLLTTSTPLSCVNRTGWNPDNRNTLQTTRSTHCVNTSFFLLTFKLLRWWDKHINGLKERCKTAGKWPWSEGCWTVNRNIQKVFIPSYIFHYFLWGSLMSEKKSGFSLIKLHWVPQEVSPNPESSRLSSMSTSVFPVPTVVHGVWKSL